MALDIAQAESVSVHQRLEGYYRDGFTGQWQPYAINGTFSILAGMLALTLPVLSDSDVFAYAGGILVARGALALVSTLREPKLAEYAISLPSAFLYLAAGICLMLNIFTDPISLIWLFSGYFVSTGAATILFAVSYRRQYSRHWEWLLISGVLNLDFALICLSRLPEDFIWSLAIFLGLESIAQGSALLGIALTSSDYAAQRADA